MILPDQIRSGPVVVFDLEYTSWEGARERNWSGPGEYREIVEIGAVLLDFAPGLPEIGALAEFARPRLNPQLSDYFTRLTGIAQAELDARGREFALVQGAFSAFCRPALELGGPRILSYGADGEIYCENERLAGLPSSIPITAFLDIRVPLARAAGLNWAKVDSGDLLSAAGFKPLARAHRALGDARSIAQMLRHLEVAGE